MRRKPCLFAVVLLMSVAVCYGKEEQSQLENNYRRVQAYVPKATPYQSVLSSEGRFVNVFNVDLVPYIKNKLTVEHFDSLDTLLRPHLKIGLTSKGFAQAAERVEEGAKDDTNYNAIWVRDSGWIFFSMLERSKVDRAEKEKARMLILSLWDYYAKSHQFRRIKEIIAKPKLATQGTMHVPHIRFDGNSKNLDDVYVKGKPQNWNHRQNDAHGLFLMGVAEAYRYGLLTENDLTTARLNVLSLFPSYFLSIQFDQYEDAGAWEEINKVNTSSIALVVKAFELWTDLLRVKPSLRMKMEEHAEANGAMWNAHLLSRLISNGYNTIKRHLYMGGESPDYPPNDLRFRRADASLFNLIIPVPLERLSMQEKRMAVQIIEQLIRPFGVLRYERDSYQSGNYWIQEPGKTKGGGPSLTGDASSDDLFLARLAKLMPGSEAQWFFDSKLAMIRAHLAEQEKDPILKEQDIFLAQVHLKRAIGQITGDKLVTADGKPVKKWLVPESINTVKLKSIYYYLPSPITPLNWAKASLSMALDRVKPFIK